MEEKKHEPLNINISGKSDEKSKESTFSSQFEIMEEKKDEPLNVDTSGKSDEKSLTPSTSKDDDRESSESDVILKELQNIKISSGSSDEESSFPPPSSESYIRSTFSSQSEIMEEKDEPLNVDTSDKSDEKLPPPFTPTDYDGYSTDATCYPEIVPWKHKPLSASRESEESKKSLSPAMSSDDGDLSAHTNITYITEEEKTEPLNVDISDNSDEKSPSPSISKDYEGEAAHSNIMEEEKHEPLNVDTSGKSDEKSPSSSKDYDGESIPSEIVEEMAGKSLSSDSSIGESDGKSSSPLPPKDYDGTMQVFTGGEAHLNVPKSNYSLKETTCLVPVPTTGISSITISPTCAIVIKKLNRLMLSTIDPSLPSPSKFIPDIIGKPSTSKSDLNLVCPHPSSDSQSSQKCILEEQVATEAPTDSTNVSNKSADDELIEQIIHTHLAIETRNDTTNPTLSDNQATTELSSVNYTGLRLIIALLLYSTFFYLFISYSHYGVSLIDVIQQKLGYTNTSTSDVFKMKEEILDHDKTIRDLTDYFQQDVSLLKVIVLISNASVDKLYTVDIIRKKFGRRSNNGRVSLYPNFIAIENLKLENFNVVINFVKMYREIYPRDQQGIILADFKIDDDLTSINLNKTINTLRSTFTEANIGIKVLFYESLNEGTVEKYITNMAKNLRETFSQVQIDKIKRHLIED